MIRILVVDDSEAMRSLLVRSLSGVDTFEVVGTAGDPYQARDRILELRPDVVTLDIEMPRMNGLTFLQKLMAHYPLPVVIISSLTTANSEAALQAFRYGAVDVLLKPGSVAEARRFSIVLKRKILAAAAARLQPRPDKSLEKTLSCPVRGQEALLAIGASTGGIETILQVISAMPPDIPPTVIVQHLPPTFTTAFARMLRTQSGLDVLEAQGGELLQTGRVVVAPGDRHLLVKRQGGQWVAEVKDGPEVCFQRPSVEVLFLSVAQQAPGRAVGVLLTGMGNDGASGLLAMKKAGCHTIAQDEASCVVYGMPKAAAELDAATAILPLERIPRGIWAGFQRLSRPSC